MGEKKPEKVPIIDSLDDEKLNSDPFFTEADYCLVSRKSDRILRVRNQGHTDTCYAFVVTATMFGDEVRNRRHSHQGSTQEYLDYIHQYRRPNSVIKDLGPEGPFPVPSTGFLFSYKAAFGYVEKHGVSPETLYPWVGQSKFNWYDGGIWDGKVECKGRQINVEEKISIKGYTHVDPKNEIEKVLQEQPVTGRIIMTDALRVWRGGGIYKGLNAGVKVGAHAITIVGYGVQGDDRYYICQNSYGQNWGYKGYFKVDRRLVTHTYVPTGTCCSENWKKRNEDDMSPEVPNKGSHLSNMDAMGNRGVKRKHN